MAFTDDDLKRLKEEFPDALGPLIARLEAAERVCESADTLIEQSYVQDVGFRQANEVHWGRMRNAFDAWRKAAGK